MIRTYKNVDGKGNVTYVDYDVAEPTDEPEEITLEDALAALKRLGVDINDV